MAGQLCCEPPQPGAALLLSACSMCEGCLLHGVEQGRVWCQDLLPRHAMHPASGQMLKLLGRMSAARQRRCSARRLPLAGQEPPASAGDAPPGLPGRWPAMALAQHRARGGLAALQRAGSEPHDCEVRRTWSSSMHSADVMSSGLPPERSSSSSGPGCCARPVVWTLSWPASLSLPVDLLNAAQNPELCGPSRTQSRRCRAAGCLGLHSVEHPVLVQGGPGSLLRSRAADRHHLGQWLRAPGGCTLPGPGLHHHSGARRRALHAW